MRNFFDQNNSLLKEKYPSLARRSKQVISKDINVTEAKTGDPTATVKGILLHSKYNPVKEALKFTETNNIKRGDHLVLYGFGLGYHVEKMLDVIGDDGRLVVIETNEQVFKAAMMFRDLSGILTAHNVNIICAVSSYKFYQKNGTDIIERERKQQWS